MRNSFKKYISPNLTFLLCEKNDVLTASYGIDFEQPGADFGWEDQNDKNLGWGA